MTIVLILANSVDPGEMQHYAAFHLGLHCLPEYPFRGIQYTKDYRYVNVYIACLVSKKQNVLQRKDTFFRTTVDNELLTPNSTNRIKFQTMATILSDGLLQCVFQKSSDRKYATVGEFEPGLAVTVIVICCSCN